MNNQTGKARAFADLHRKGEPLVLHNIWDAGSAKAAEEAGAAAIATGSWSVAAAQGYPDGEQIPLELLMTIVERIVAMVTLPVSVDIEGGYGTDPATLSKTVERVMDTGAIGINFEDGMIGGEGMHSTEFQCTRIRAIRQVADNRKLPFFINARTDLFLNEKNPAEHAALLDEAIARGLAYHDAGASGLFVPGLIDETLVARLCDALPMPVNVMMMDGAPSPVRLAALGVARISHGPLPYVVTMQGLRDFMTGTSY
jgi:2-methylisocitrate lyase-like PEP mutase family enzyme